MTSNEFWDQFETRIRQDGPATLRCCQKERMRKQSVRLGR